MARKVTYIPTAPSNGSSGMLPLASIPQEVIDEVEEVYAALKANPNGRMRAEFDTKAELALYMTQVTSYCAQRVVNDVAAPLRFRKSPTKNLPETTMDFRIGDPIPAKEEAASAETPEPPVNTPVENPTKSTRPSPRKK